MTASFEPDRSGAVLVPRLVEASSLDSIPTSVPVSSSADGDANTWFTWWWAHSRYFILDASLAHGWGRGSNSRCQASSGLLNFNDDWFSKFWFPGTGPHVVQATSLYRLSFFSC